MDINLLRGLATITVLIAFIGICVWAYSGKRKKGFEEAANLPFADDSVANNQPPKSIADNHELGERKQ